MIIIANADGSLSNVKPSSVYQGSNLANEIIFIGEFARNCTVCISYTLPDGSTLDETFLTYRESIQCDGVDRYSVWVGTMKGKVSAKAGNVTAQIFVYPPQYTVDGTIDNPRIAINSFEFTVNKGVPSGYNATTMVDIQDVKNYISTTIYGFNDELNGKLSLKVNKNDIDTKLNKNSNNPIANSVVTAKLEELENKAPDLTEVNNEIAKIKSKTDIIKTGGSSTKFLNEEGKYTEACECDGKQVFVDDAMSKTSTNPVQNKVITEELEKKQDKLTAGDNITIKNGVISAQGGSGGVSQEYVDTELAKKVTLTVENRNGLFGWYYGGNKQQFYGIGTNNSNLNNGTIAQYFGGTQTVADRKPTDGTGFLYCAEPEKPYHSANKKYVDDTVGLKIYKHSFTLVCKYELEDTETLEYNGFFYALTKDLLLKKQGDAGFIIENTNIDKVVSDIIYENDSGLKKMTLMPEGFYMGDFGSVYVVEINETV